MAASNANPTKAVSGASARTGSARQALFIAEKSVLLAL